MMRTSRARARDEFLHTIKVQAPEVLATLASDVLPVYKEFVDANGPFSGVNISPAWLLNYASFRRLPEEWRGGPWTLPLADAVLDWAERWRIVVDWCLEMEMWALHQLANPDYKGEPDWYHGMMMDSWMGEFDRFRFDPWRPDADTWENYRAKVMKAFSAHLSEYREKILTNHAKSGGYLIKMVPPHHYGWLVEYQIRGRGFAEIASAHGPKGVHATTVREAVTKLATFIGLELRPAKRGRPAGKVGRYASSV